MTPDRSARNYRIQADTASEIERPEPLQLDRGPAWLPGNGHTAADLDDELPF